MELPLADQPLLPLPAQPSDVPWPTDGWPSGTIPDGAAVESLIDAMFAAPDTFGDTYAVVVVQQGRLLTERYGGVLPHFDRPSEPVEPSTNLLSWSMAKSILHA